MNLFYRSPIILYFCLLGVLPLSGAQAIEGNLFYRWIDKTGKVYYSDKVTPDHAGYRREQINDQGVTVKTIERPKTPEEFAKQRKLQRLRFQQKKLIEQQEARDRLLLYTFEDVTNSLGDKLSTLDSKLKIVRTSIKQLEQQLKEQKKSAAQWEKGGRKVPQTIIFKIDEIQNLISSYQAAVIQHSTKRESLQLEYAKDAQRYKKLVNHQYQKINAQKTFNASNSEDELSVINCSSKKQCQKAWQLTKEYLINNPSGKKLITDSNLVVSTSAPVNQNDIGASAVLIRKGPEQSTIFLDVHCKKTIIGMERCNRDDTKNWLLGYRVYVLSRLKVKG
jgi:hypothetical protein